ncbi:AMP-binding protein [Microbispora sp. RL4-1S]|uniref:AMP-binding protein n=1 Tax=Microbispora oryzae TaxID=2806554 RepID=A0A940WEM4_9ACTN|nr:AMP-binding protein [Microbispora oryzae]
MAAPVSGPVWETGPDTAPWTAPDDAYWGPRRTPAHAAFRAARDVLLEHRDDIDAARARFDWPRPAHFNWALEWFDVIAAGNDAPALILLDGAGGATEVSYAELSRGSDAVAAWLCALGVRRRDRVLIALDQRRELWEVILACLKIGAVVIPTYTSLTPPEAADRVERGGVRHVVCASWLTHLFPVRAGGGARIAVGEPVDGWLRYDEGAAHPGRFVPAEPTPADDVAFCYFTSGTTSAPKLVAHTHVSYPVGHLSGLYWSGLTPGDRHLNVSAPGWAKHSWSSLFVPWNAEAAVVALPPGPVPAERLPWLLAHHEVTTFCAPPSTWRAMLPALLDPLPAHGGPGPFPARPRLREALSAGEPLDGRVAEAVERAWGVAVRDGYGQTETTGLIGTSPGLGRRPGWLGRPLPGYDITLRDPETGEAGDAGEVCVELTPRPAGVMRGYLAADGGVTAPGGGYYRTGDMGERSEDGWIRIHGRRDDVFKSFDRRVSPYELEAVLRRHPAVADAAVVPRPHPVGGAVPHAVVELVRPGDGGPELERELLAHVDAHVTEDLRVHSVQVSPRLPRTASGKVRRAAIRI